MKSGHRAKAYRLWRTGHEGLTRIQRIVDKAIKDAEESDAKEACFSGLPDLKLRINRELRDNAAFELRHRRESLELEDVELAHKTDLAYLKRVKDRVEGQLKDLLDLDDLKSVLAGKSTATIIAMDTPSDPGHEATPSSGPSADLQLVADTAMESIGNPAESQGSSEVTPDAIDGAQDTAQTESRTDEVVGPSCPSVP